ncbi:hypothetical protein BaRGS_00014114 [Batillaria attramentaria]|uniref:MD-2-related lipid-recognition domain-containing protein n=1 Tax=Batillaria attramentaria TaxID=370345 RepID=A0ABD0L5W6_9CAEN
MPVVVPGDIQLTVDASYGRPLGDVTIDLSIRRHTFLLDLPIPCIAHVGSCTYESSCSSMLLDTMVAEDWAGIMGDIGSQVETMLETSIPNITTAGCPYPARSINIDHYTLHLPPVPTILSWFAEGDYGARAEVTDKATGDMLLCLHLDLTIKEPCTGFFCG